MVEPGGPQEQHTHAAVMQHIQHRPRGVVADEQRGRDDGGVVSFVPADIIDETAEGIWVAGLPRNALLVAEGQDNVGAGLRVTPDVREEAGASAP